MSKIVSCFNCGQVIGDDEERGWTATTPRHVIHARCRKKLTKHERELISENWHTRTQAQFQDKSVEELKAILADAREAAIAARGMPSEGKYLDEVHYAVAELRRRENKPAPLVNFPFVEAAEEIGPTRDTLTEQNIRDGLLIQNKIRPEWGDWVVGHDRNGWTIRGDRGSRMLGSLDSGSGEGDWKIVRDTQGRAVGDTHGSSRRKARRQAYRERHSRKARLSR